MATHFFWDPVEDNIIQERDDTGTVTADYTTEPYLYGDLISQRHDGQSRFAGRARYESPDLPVDRAAGAKRAGHLSVQLHTNGG
jgi:hypothetical protein